MDLRFKIEQALDQIRPYLLADGGNVSFLEISEDATLYLQLLGACGTCPMSFMTVKAGIEEAIRKEVPEIKLVITLNHFDGKLV